MHFQDYILSEKDIAAIKIANDYEYKNNVEYSEIVSQKIGVLLELIDSLFQQKIQIPSWQVWSEPLIVKLCFHSVSIIKLFDGIELPIHREGKKPVVLDEPSIITIFRVILENYLTFFFLYCDNISNEEKQFRLAVWRNCGIKQRIGFDISTEEAIKKQKEESHLLEQLRKEIEETSYFRSYTKEEKKLLLKGVKPRLFFSWIQLVKLSGMRERVFKNLYGYKSNYSHSEFISVLQIHSKTSNLKPPRKFTILYSCFI